MNAEQTLLALLRRLYDWSIATGGWEAPVWRDVQRTLMQYNAGEHATAGGAFEDCASAACAADGNAADENDTDESRRGLVVGSYECPECGYLWSELAALFAQATCPRCAEPHVEPYDCRNETTPPGDEWHFELSPF